MKKNLLALSFLVLASHAMALDIRGLSNGRGDIASSGEYDAYRSALSSIGYSVSSGVSSVTAANLAGMEAFHANEPSVALSGGEATDLAAWVNAGGKLIVEGDSTSTISVLNSFSQALGLGNVFSGSTGGNNGSAAGTFSSNVTRTTVGPHGDLRGLSFGGSITQSLALNGGTLVGTNSVDNWVEFQIGSGYALFVGDPLSIDIFAEVGNGLYNPNNMSAYKNYLDPVPEPMTLLVFGGLAAMAARRKRASA